MWVRDQFNEIQKIDNIYTHNGFVISSVVGNSSLPVELATYESEEECLYVINMFWGNLIDGARTFKMPPFGFARPKQPNIKDDLKLKRRDEECQN